mgnify:FL=1
MFVPKQSLQLSGGGRFQATSVQPVQMPRNYSYLGGNVSGGVTRGPNPQMGEMDDAAYQQDMRSVGAINKMTSDLFTVMEKVQEDMDVAAVKDADNKLSEAVRKAMNDPENGYLSTAGKRALAARPDVESGLVDVNDNIMKGLSTQRQRDAYEQTSRQRLSAALNSMDKHALSQAKVYKAAESAVRVDSAMQDAIANWGTWVDKDTNGNGTGEYYKYKATMLEEIRGSVEMAGFVPGTQEYNMAVKTAQVGALTELHKQIVQNMVTDERIPEANAYLNEALESGEIDGASYDVIAKLVKTGGDKKQSLDLYNVISGADEKTQMDQAKKWYDDGVVSSDAYDMLVNRIDNGRTRRKQQEAEFEDGVMIDMQNWAFENQDKLWSDMPTDMLTALKETGRLDDAKIFIENGAFAHDEDAWIEFTTTPQAELDKMTPSEFRNKYGNKLDAQHLASGEDMVGRAKMTIEAEQFLDEKERVKTRLQQVGLYSYGTPQEKDKKNLSNYMLAFEKKVNLYKKREGRTTDLTTGELNQILDDMQIDFVYDERGWGSTAVPRGVVEPDKLDNYYVKTPYGNVGMETLPMNKEPYYMEILRNNNLPTTTEAFATFSAKFAEYEQEIKATGYPVTPERIDQLLKLDLRQEDKKDKEQKEKDAALNDLNAGYIVGVL